LLPAAARLAGARQRRRPRGGPRQFRGEMELAARGRERLHLRRHRRGARPRGRPAGGRPLRGAHGVLRAHHPPPGRSLRAPRHEYRDGVDHRSGAREHRGGARAAARARGAAALHLGGRLLARDDPARRRHRAVVRPPRPPSPGVRAVTVYLMAGGGTAGHVNPLLATADRLREREPDAEVLVLGTAEGLEARLVPARGYELVTIPRLPFPRRPNADAVRFPGRWKASVERTREILRERGVDAVVGFGGYAAAPAYTAAHREQLPLVIHEANARPGIANRLGARYTPYVGTVFPATRIRHGRVVGLPLRREIEHLDRFAARPEAFALL